MRTGPANHRKLLVFVVGSSAWFGCTSFSAEVAGPVEAGVGEADAGGDGASGEASDGGPAAPLLLDTFTRMQATGWGTAEIGGAWRITGAASVKDGVGRMLPAAGKGVFAFADSISASDIDLQAVVTTSAVGTTDDAGAGIGSGLYISLSGRATADGSSAYSGSVIVQNGGAVGIGLTVRLGGVDTSLLRINAGSTIIAGEALRVRIQIEGTMPTRLRGKAWKASVSEPDGWPAEVQDGTPSLQQQPGRVFLTTYLSASSDVPVTATFDELTVRQLP